MSLVATDGHRLALVIGAARRGARAKPDDEVRVILPRKTLLELGAAPGGGRRATFSTSAARTICSSTSAAAC